METIREFLQQWDFLGFTIAGFIGLLIGLIYKGIKNLVIMKRKPYNISRQTINRTIYDNRNEGDFAIRVLYKGKVYEDPLTILRIRLLNDGENDINYIRQCTKPVSVEIGESTKLIDVYLEPSNAEMDLTITATGNNKFDLSWSLLKRDEYIDLVIVAKGKDLAQEQVKMTLRAEGIEKIKSPEYRVWPQLWPILLADAIMVLLCWFFMSKEASIIPLIPERVLWSCLFLLFAPLFTILVLVKRIRWEKE